MAARRGPAPPSALPTGVKRTPGSARVRWVVLRTDDSDLRQANRICWTVSPLDEMSGDDKRPVLRIVR